MMIIKIKPLIIAILTLTSTGLLTACAKNSSSTASALNTKESTVTPEVLIKSSIEKLEGSWQIESIKEQPVIDRSSAQFIFMKSDNLDKNKLSGSATCNGMFSSYNVNHSKKTLSFAATAVTRKMCPPALMEQESRLLAALPLAHNYQIKQNILYIFDENRVLLFKASKVR